MNLRPSWIRELLFLGAAVGVGLLVGRLLLAGPAEVPPPTAHPTGQIARPNPAQIEGAEELWSDTAGAVRANSGEPPEGLDPDSVIDLDEGVPAFVPPRVLVANALGVPVESVTPESVAGFANKDATMGSPAWVAYHHIVMPANAGAGADILDVPPAVVRTVAGETTHRVFVSDAEMARRDRTALLHSVCGILEKGGLFNDYSPESSARLMAVAESITDNQLARDVDWDEMISGATAEMCEMCD